ncbi:MAG: hypothetical protein ACI9N9_002540, partial [Enterobacterales bacterium]
GASLLILMIGVRPMVSIIESYIIIVPYFLDGNLQLDTINNYLTRGISIPSS